METLMALFAGLAAIAWLVIIALLHFIKPGLNPSVRMMSEYALEPNGWIMRLAFFLIATSCGALAFAAWPLLPHHALLLLATCGVGFAGAGIFVTDPRFTAKAVTKSGRLHNAFSLIVILLFPIMATVVGANMANHAAWASVRAWLPVIGAPVWAGFLAFVGSAAYAVRCKETPLGYFQRFMVLTYTTWLTVAAFGMVVAR
jgi:hypothetical protein